MDLLQADAVEQAASDVGWRNLRPGIRALWTTPHPGEAGAPRHRIIHARLLQLPSPATLHRFGLRAGTGYHKCGSRPQIDWVSACRLLVWRGGRWEVVLDEQEIPRPRDEHPRWFTLPGIVASAAIVELRQCSVDRWWTSWNLARNGILLEGERNDMPLSHRESRLTIGRIDLAKVPRNVVAVQLPGEVRFRTDSFHVGFWLGRPGFSFLGLDDSARGRTGRNLLRTSPAVFLQGPRFHAVGEPPLVAPLLCSDMSGTVSVQGSTVRYEVRIGESGQEYLLEWNVEEKGLAFRFARRAAGAVRAWESSAWTIACHSEVTPTAALGDVTRHGETGILRLPVLFHAPGHGTLRISSNDRTAICRSDSSRPLVLTTLELKCGEIPQPEGDYLLPAGEHVLEGEIAPYQQPLAIPAKTPRAVAEALRRCAVTSQTYRPDTATLTNNGNSMHAPLCMDLWSSVAAKIDAIAPGLRAMEMLRDSLERWLDGGPGYASGGMVGDDGVHCAEDEFIMTGTAGLLGLAEYLEHGCTSEWLELYRLPIERQLDLMCRRDVDRDGLVESVFRHGRSNGYQWSTNWYDVISFGWKDAFSNALLYRALVVLAAVLPRLGKPGLSEGLADWAVRLRSSYRDAFFNPKTGWFAGWRCRDNVLHDYAFLSVNGAAVCAGVVDGEQARLIVQNLWAEARRIGLPDPRLGLPGNLWPVPDSDMIPFMHGKPMGFYINGGLTHSQSRHFVGALYRVGMTQEADVLLEALCETLADGTAFGGCNTGVDWRYWDGAPCGYEGVLTDQFGILAVAVDRYCRAGGPPWH
jgi:hypothetical protein